MLQLRTGNRIQRRRAKKHSPRLTAVQAVNQETLMLALQNAVPGTVIELASGDYGDLILDGNVTPYLKYAGPEQVTITSVDGNRGAVFNSIEIVNTSFLTLDNIKVYKKNVVIPADSLKYKNLTSPFVVGETVTGQTSGATAIIESIIENGAVGTLRVHDVPPGWSFFKGNEVITCGGGGLANVDGSYSHFAAPLDGYRIARTNSNINLHIIDVEFMTAPDGNPSNDPFGLWTGGEVDCIIQDCLFHDLDRALGAHAWTNGIIRGNLFYDIRSDMMNASGADGLLIENNTGIRWHPTYDHAHPDFIQFWATQDGGPGTTHGNSQHVTIRGNIFIPGPPLPGLRGSAPQGIFIRATGGRFFHDFLIEDNLICTWSAWGIFVESGNEGPIIATHVGDGITTAFTWDGDIPYDVGIKALVKINGVWNWGVSYTVWRSGTGIDNEVRFASPPGDGNDIKILAQPLSTDIIVRNNTVVTDQFRTLSSNHAGIALRNYTAGEITNNVATRYEANVASYSGEVRVQHDRPYSDNHYNSVFLSPDNIKDEVVLPNAALGFLPIPGGPADGIGAQAHLLEAFGEPTAWASTTVVDQLMAGNVVEFYAADYLANSVPTGGNVTIEWDFGDGSPTATGRTVEHTYADFGEYAVTLTVTDPDTNTDFETTQTIYVVSAASVYMPFEQSVENLGEAGKTATWGDPLKEAYVEHDGGWAAQFDGTTGGRVSLNVESWWFPGMETLTVSVDFKLTGTQTGRLVWHGGSGFGFNIGPTTANAWVDTVGAVGKWTNGSGFGNLNDGNWHTVVLTYTAATGVATLYVDGVDPVSTSGHSGAIRTVSESNAGRLWIGGWSASNNHAQVDNVLVINGVVPPTDMATFLAQYT
jgi:PKD repeat protein